MKDGPSGLWRDERGFVWFDDVKLPVRLLPSGHLEFVDKDKRRAEERGTRFLAIDLADFIDLFLRGTNGSK